MTVHLAKGFAAAAALGTIAIKDVALYVGIVSTLSGVAVIGAIWAAARAWRERAEARDDEATELRQELKNALARIAENDGIIAELRRRGDVDAASQRAHEEHMQITKALAQLTTTCAGIQTALEFLFKQAFPSAMFPVQASEEKEKSA